LKTSFAKVRVYASLSHLSRGEMSKDGTQQVPPFELSHLSRGEMSKDGTQQVPPFELSPLRVDVTRGQ